MTTQTLREHFDQHFEALPVKDEATRQEVFRLRYAVYCEELGYEDRSAFPDGQERDAYDEDSAFALLKHRATGRAAGCVRLIVNAAKPSLRFPFELVCSDRLDRTLIDVDHVDRSRIGEISRLAVHHDFRRREGEALNPEGVPPSPSELASDRRYPLVAMGLFLSASALALNRGLNEVMVMMEPRLARLLARCGIRFTQIGEVIDFHGLRGPFRITREELIGNLRPESGELLDMLVKTLL